jgi:halocyanin-like protein
MSDERDARLGQRRLLRAGAGAVGAGLVGAGTAGTATAQSGPFGGWMSDVGNYDGSVDQTGNDGVTVEVGVEQGQGAFGFGPPAIQVDTGTTVTWEWTGDGGVHNVAAEEGGDFSSETTQEAGFTYEQTFEESGVVKYFCQPHRALGMKGVVVVGDVDTGAEVIGGGGGSGGGGEGGGGGGGSGGEGSSEGDGFFEGAGLVMSLTIAGSIVAAFLSPIVFGLVLMLRDKTGDPPDESVDHGESSH